MVSSSWMKKMDLLNKKISRCGWGMSKICEVCGKIEEYSDEIHDIYGVCLNCMDDRDFERYQINNLE